LPESAAIVKFLLRENWYAHSLASEKLNVVVVETERAKCFLPKNYLKQPIRDNASHRAHARKLVMRMPARLFQGQIQL